MHLLHEETISSVKEDNALCMPSKCVCTGQVASSYPTVQVAPCDFICNCPESVMQATVLLHGAALNQDGRSSSLTAPSGPAQQSLIRSALQSAHMPPSRVSAPNSLCIHVCVAGRWPAQYHQASPGSGSRLNGCDLVGPTIAPA